MCKDAHVWEAWTLEKIWKQHPVYGTYLSSGFPLLSEFYCNDNLIIL